MRDLCIICGYELKKFNFTSKCKKCAFIFHILKQFRCASGRNKQCQNRNFNKILDLIKSEINDNCKMLEIGPGKGFL